MGCLAPFSSSYLDLLCLFLSRSVPLWSWLIFWLPENEQNDTEVRARVYLFPHQQGQKSVRFFSMHWRACGGEKGKPLNPDTATTNTSPSITPGAQEGVNLTQQVVAPLDWRAERCAPRARQSANGQRAPRGSRSTLIGSLWQCLLCRGRAPRGDFSFNHWIFPLQPFVLNTFLCTFPPQNQN